MASALPQQRTVGVTSAVYAGSHRCVLDVLRTRSHLSQLTGPLGALLVQFLKNVLELKQQGVQS